MSKTAKQLLSMLHDFAVGSPINIRKMNSEAKKIALEIGMIQREYKKKYRYGEHFMPHADAPAWLIWELFKDEIGEGIGKSLNKSKKWLDLEIWNQGDRFETPRDLEKREYTLFRLQDAGFIYWQAAGEIWDIRPTGKDHEEHPHI